MHIVILGCGRVGSTLAHTLEDSGHTVAVVDRSPEAFRRLRSATAKTAVTGLGHDRDALVRAGIERADAFAAVSSGDNSNIIAARVARETFGVRNVVARIYDPRRAEVYQRLGIPTVGTVHWTADTILRRLLPSDASPTGGTPWHDPSGALVMAAGTPGPQWSDRTVDEIETALGLRVAYLERAGAALLPRGDTRVVDGDVVHVLTKTEAARELLARLGADEDEEGRA
ncbi:potassium channel family protein [Nocardiopsis ansamitocini]|uniref:Trk system potassium uptake protein TrkA n=1 Tax=Nocardiopsis ansamitocini TaxID=1670832 RepID=A0A9W6P8C2_9ACTN|nr:TrkA family potassium uptake protein [Nocardiopsis ansamitocini]GLU49020.1 Trk system potassium uptake protein TrkA [Nocardiopsis ansamitocini]